MSGLSEFLTIQIVADLHICSRKYKKKLQVVGNLSKIIVLIGGANAKKSCGKFLTRVIEPESISWAVYEEKDCGVKN